MKAIYKLFTLFGIAVLMTVTGCKKYLDVNTDPDRPENAPPAAVLSAAEVAGAYVLGGADVSLVTGILINQVDGADRQFAAYQKYLLVADNFTQPWTTIYQGTLNNLVDLTKATTEKKYFYFSGMSRILTAYILCVTTDIWGDVPYADAFKGLSFQFTSKYDKQEDIYKTLDQLITDGIKDLNTPSAQAGVLPGKSDLIYGGNAGAWIKLANSLRLRILIHQTKKLGITAAQQVIAAAAAPGGLITTAADDAQVNFLNDETRANPLYQFNDQRSGYAAYDGSYMITAMTALEDSRVDRYLPGGFYDVINSPVLLLTSYEVNFILAEAYARLNQPAKAKTAYEAAVAASFAKVGADATGYLDKPEVSFDAAPDKLKVILTQKYYAMYLQAEAFTDWRRTGIPVLTPKVTSQEIPRRLPYPQTELSYNAQNVPKGVTAATRMWWDQ